MSQPFRVEIYGHLYLTDLGNRTPEQVTSRLEQLIRRIKDQFEADASTVGPRDVVCVAHSHILSAFAILWTGRSLQDGIRLLLDTAGVAILRYVISV